MMRETYMQSIAAQPSSPDVHLTPNTDFPFIKNKIKSDRELFQPNNAAVVQSIARPLK